MNKRISKAYSCYFEGLQEKKYFKHISKKLSEYDRNISIKFNEVEKLKTLERGSTGLKKVAFFDYDCNKSNFEQCVCTCKKTKPYYTNLNFDLWLLLHKRQFTKVVNNNNDYHDAIRETYGLPKTANIKNEKMIDRMLEQIELSDIEFAISNAKEIMSRKNTADMKFVNKFGYFDNPSMNIHEFVDELLTDVKNECEIEKF